MAPSASPARSSGSTPRRSRLARPALTPARGSVVIPPDAGFPAPAAAAAHRPPTPPAPRRPINPYLANDPDTKAKRLARALVSDMLTYYPAKHQEALANGTLKESFREEIRKSFEEYVDQIGREVAERTSHFQEALNELLAKGERIF
jgi:hypothetical protein